MPVRHISPFARSNCSAMLRTAAGPSAIIGMPPASAKRPVTGVLPGLKTSALERRTPAPLLSKVPAMQTPLAWLRRNPGCGPLTCWNVSMIRVWVSAPGWNQPPVQAKSAATPATIAPIRPSRASDAGAISDANA